MTSAFAALDDPKKPKPADPAQSPDFNPLGDPAGAAASPVAPPAPAAPMGAPPANNGAMAAPKTPAAPAAPAVPAATPDPNQVWGTLTAQFQQKHGRAMTPDEAKALQGYAGYTGGAINQAMIDKATQGINAYTGNLANPFGPAAAAPPPTPATATNDLAQKTLQDILNQGDAVDMDNPALLAQRTNFDRVNSRETGRTRLAAAERAAARGTLGSGGFDADISAAEQGQGDRASSFESQLMAQEMSAQRSKLQNALQLAVQSGDANAARQLQERLGTLDLNLREKLGKGQLSLGLLQSLLQDKQAGNNLGFNYTALGQQGNTDLMRIIAGL